MYIIFWLKHWILEELENFSIKNININSVIDLKSTNMRHNRKLFSD